MDALIYSLTKRNIRTKRPKEITCFDCREKSSMNVNSYVKTFDIFFIPILPYAMWQEVSCVSCNATISFREMGPELREQYKPFRKFPFPKPWHFSWPLIILGIFIWSKRETTIPKDELLLRAETIKVNRMITIRIDETSIASLEVIAVNDQSVQVIQNQQDTLLLSRDTLTKWVQSERITNIYWPR